MSEIIEDHQSALTPHRDTDEDYLIQRTDCEEELTPKYKTYRRRWYILLVYFLAAVTQSCISTTFNAIATSAECAFGWADTEIALQQIWPLVTFLVTICPLLWVVNRKGLRLSVIICALLFTIATAVRCITTIPPYITWLTDFSQVINGMGGPIALALPPLISVTWFPPNERATATGIASSAGLLGMATSFQLCPIIVQQLFPTNTTSTLGLRTIFESAHFGLRKRCGIILNSTVIIQERWEIQKLMFIECGWSVGLLLLILVYFPSRPKLPPSQSACMKRIYFKSGFIKLIRNRNMWLISIAFGLMNVFGVWATMIEVIMRNNLSQVQASQVAFCSIAFGCLAAFTVGRCADCFIGHLKKILVMLLMVAVAGCVWIVLLAEGYLRFSLVEIYISVTLVGIMIYGSIPLFFELACEVGYPVPEILSAGLVCTMYSLFGLIYMVIPMVLPFGKQIINWCMLGSVSLAVPLVLFFKESYNRLNVDIGGGDRPKEIHVNACEEDISDNTGTSPELL